MDRVDDIIKKAKTGALNPLQKLGGTGPLQAPGQQQGAKPEIGKDRGNAGFDVGEAMKNTGRLPSLGGDGIPKVGNDALDALRKGTGQLNNLAGQVQKGGSNTLDQLKGLMNKGEQGANDAIDGVTSVKDELKHVGKGISAAADVYTIAKNAKALMASDDVVRGVKIAAEGADVLDDAAKVGKFGKVMAGVGVGLAVADLAYQSYRASQWDELSDAERASVCLNMAGSTLTIVGTFCPPPANAAVLGVGAVFSLAAIGADYWPEISAGGGVAIKEAGKLGKEAGKAIEQGAGQAGKALDKAADKALDEARKAKAAAEKAAKEAAEKAAAEAKKAAEKAAEEAKKAAEKAAKEAAAAAEKAAKEAAEAAAKEAKKAVNTVKKVSKKLKFW